MYGVIILCFCHTAISQFSVAAISSVIDCKKLESAQIAQINQLFQLFNLICAYGDTFYGVTLMLMNKNVNNDISEDSPIT